MYLLYLLRHICYTLGRFMRLNGDFVILLLHAYRRPLNKTVGNKDYPLKKCYITAYSWMHFSSQNCVIINLNQREYDRNKKQTCKSHYQQYIERNSRHSHLSIHEYAQRYNLKTRNKLSKLVFPRVLPCTDLGISQNFITSNQYYRKPIFRKYRTDI